jgi:S1-C subfamily serine protease
MTAPDDDFPDDEPSDGPRPNSPRRHDDVEDGSTAGRTTTPAFETRTASADPPPRESADLRGHEPGQASSESDDDLDGLQTPMSRLVGSARSWLGVLVAIALVVPAGAWLVDEFAFQRSADAVVATLDGELSGADAAATVLLVRSLGCAGAPSSTGSAFVVDTPSGPALLTNRHVVDDADTVGVRGLDGSTDVEVTGVRVSDAADVAVLEVAAPQQLPPALELRSSALEVGASVRLIGFPAGAPFTTEGRIAELAGSRMLLDLDVDPGASGSPVVGEGGEVVGQVYAVTSDGRGVATSVDALLGAIADAEAIDPC